MIQLECKKEGGNMYTNSASRKHKKSVYRDESKPLIVNSCGTYRLYTQPKLPTYRPRGRLDFQLLYIAGGRAHFYFDGKEEIVTAGHMVVYRPREVQKYEYFGAEQTEVYWVHFTGSDVTEIMRDYGIPEDRHLFYCGNSLEYQNLFRHMIQELQQQGENHEEMLSMMLRQIFILMQRKHTNIKGRDNYAMAGEIDDSVLYFNEHYNTELCIEKYAEEHHMSTSWFIRNFKKYMGVTPMQYILSLRISNAENLLEMTDYNLTEISSIIGYDNPLYFSRIFKKQKGISPSEYRKRIRRGE